jgi:hypothetical protein
MATLKHPTAWKGSGLQYAQAMANNSFSRTAGDESANRDPEREVRRVVNLNHFGPHVPAAAYYEQSDCFWWDMRRDGDPCATITEGRYFPDLVIPDKLKSLNPDWKDCSVVIGAQDPPVILSATKDLFVPTLHPISNPEQTAAPALAQEGGHLDPGPMPTAIGTTRQEEGSTWPKPVSTSIILDSSAVGVLYNPGAQQATAVAQPVSDGAQQTPTGAQQSGFYAGAQQSSGQNMRTQILGAQYPNVPSQGGNQPDGRVNIVIGSQTLLINGPAQTIGSQIVSFGSNGIVVGGVGSTLGAGTKTIPIFQMSQIVSYKEEASVQSTTRNLISGGSAGDVDEGSSGQAGSTAVPKSSTKKNSAASIYGIDDVFRIYMSPLGWCFYIVIIGIFDFGL